MDEAAQYKELSWKKNSKEEFLKLQYDLNVWLHYTEPKRRVFYASPEPEYVL